MQRQTLLALALVFGSLNAVAQDGSLAGVTMRVVDDISGLDAVVLELDAGGAEDADSAEVDGRDDAARDDEPSREAARDVERPAAPQPPPP
jgi:hypothetical protein